MLRIIYTIFIFFLSSCCAYAQTISSIRPSILAGSWYPADKNKLQHTITKLLSNAYVPDIKGKIRAIIVPHAGYMYSGGVAAHAFKAIRGKRYDRVIMIGPCHRTPFYGVSVNLQKGYETPLGIVSVDQKFAKKLIKNTDLIRYVPLAHAFEHCLEIELPFLQTVLKEGFKIVPILMGDQDIHTSKRLADIIVRLISSDKKKTLILASSDLSHYHSYEEAVKMDHLLIKDVCNIDPYSLNRHTLNGSCEACGKGAIMTVLFIAKELDIRKATLLKYANSGDVTGEKSRVVGYMAVVFTSP